MAHSTTIRFITAEAERQHNVEVDKKRIQAYFPQVRYAVCIKEDVLAVILHLNQVMQQKNDYDCGIYTLLFIEEFIKDSDGNADKLAGVVSLNLNNTIGMITADFQIAAQVIKKRRSPGPKNFDFTPEQITTMREHLMKLIDDTRIQYQRMVAPQTG